MRELAPHRDTRHLPRLRKLIDGSDEFAAGLQLIKKLLREPRSSWLRLTTRVDISFQNHLHIVPLKGTF
jgi:uncharacterized protein (DUF58 family)